MPDPRDTEIRLQREVIDAQRQKETERYRTPRARAKRALRAHVTPLSVQHGDRLVTLPERTVSCVLFRHR